MPFSAKPPRTARSTPVDTVQAIEAAMETALAPDRFISDHAGDPFVDDLEKVRERLAALIETEPERAIALDETFIAGCYEKAEEVDDSSGSFGAFGGSLFSGWVTARQAAGADRRTQWRDCSPGWTATSTGFAPASKRTSRLLSTTPGGPNGRYRSSACSMP